MVLLNGFIELDISKNYSFLYTNKLTYFKRPPKYAFLASTF